jgi:7-cyano-7-deazaguanine reductase
MAGVLGQTVAAPGEYTPSVLERIDRRLGREGIKNPSENIGSGHDVWHCYELSWTLPDGAVTFTTGALIVPAESPFTVESKSLKLYLNSLNAHVFKNDEAAIACIEKDLSELTQSQVKLVRIDPDQVRAMSCELYDDAVRVSGLDTTVAFRCTGFRSLCPVTAQPDWASLCVEVSVADYDESSIIQAIESLRNHQGFHEQCVEDLYSRIESALNPSALHVVGFFQRRGGIDITPWRSSALSAPRIIRLFEQ